MADVDDLPAEMLSSSFADEDVLLLMRFRVPLRMVTLVGMTFPPREPNRGDVLLESLGEALGVVLFGGGSFERTECTRSSIFCILPIRPLI